MASGQDLCRMDLDIKWWKKKSLSWEPPQILCCELLYLLNEETTDFKWKPQRHGATRGAEQTARRRLATGPLYRPASWTWGGCRTPRWTSDVVKLKRAGPLTLLSSGPSSPQDPGLSGRSRKWVMMQEGLGGQRTKGQRKLSVGLKDLEDSTPEALANTSSLSLTESRLRQRSIHEDPLLSRTPTCRPPVFLETARQTEHGTLEDMQERARQTEHGTLEDMQERPSSVRLNTGRLRTGSSEAPPGSALGSASPGEAPPLQDLHWDQPLQVKPRPSRICSRISLSRC
ncbi:hypothetical protein KUCAC02_035069 [Chaenocephalus aceratus]|nr:hypothetical protein KUCAC02_035069 [Chaenocephalus aceratus]